MNNRLINTKVAGGGGGCTDIVDNYDPFGGNGVALYQLNGDATDESPNAYNGTWSGTEAYTTGVFGQAGVFNGSSSYVELPSGIIPSNNLSFSIWFKTNDITTSQYIFGFRNTLKIYVLLNVTSNGSIRAVAGQNLTVDSASVVSANTWYHLCVTQSSTSGVTVYLNNSVVASNSSYTGDLVSVTGKNLIGANYSTSLGGVFNGSIDQVRIFDTALTPLEVEALYTEELCICDGTVDTLQILGDTSCIATYQLDGNANDLSGNYSGTPTDVSYGVGKFDLSGVFNGSSSYVITQRSSAFNIQDFTTSAWIKTSASGSYQVIASTYEGSPNPDRAWSFRLTSSNNLELGFTQTNGTNVNYITTETLSLNTWYHVVVSKSSSSVALYINGSQVLTSSASSVLYFSSTPTLGIGRLNQLGVQYFNGSIDQVRIFNKALDQNDVNTLFAETPCTYTPKSNLILHLDANDSNSWTGSGSTWFDVSGNDYNADILTPVPSTGTVGSTTYLNLSTRDDYFKIPIATHGGALSLKSGNKISFLIWMNMPTIPVGVDGINFYLRSKTSGGVSTMYSRYYYPGAADGFTTAIRDSSGNIDISSGYVATATRNEWLMVVHTYDYTTGLFGFHRYQESQATYHNYNLGTINPYPTADSDIFLFNSDEPTYGGYGYVGEIKVFDKPLDEIEMGIEYNNGKIKYGIS